MEAPKQTAVIFEILSRGQFICSNSNDESIRKLYSVIEEEQNFDFLYDYFLSINFILEKETSTITLQEWKAKLI